ncbi:6449_t:CDS:2, partial [Gigaspora rosea]
SSVATNLFDEILNYNSQLQPDENNNLTDSEEGLYPLAKGQSFSDWNDIESKKNTEIVIKMVTVNPIVQAVMRTDMK